MALYILYTRVLVLLHMLIWSSSSSVSKPLQVLNSTSHPNSHEVMPSVSSFSDSTSYGTCITESSFQLSIFNIHTHCVHGSASCCVGAAMTFPKYWISYDTCPHDLCNTELSEVVVRIMSWALLWVLNEEFVHAKVIGISYFLKG